MEPDSGCIGAVERSLRTCLSNSSRALSGSLSLSNSSILGASDLLSRRLSLYLRQHGQVGIVFLLGLALVLVGVMFSLSKAPNWATTFVSIGCSLIAAAVVTYLSPVSEEVYQKFLALGVSDVYPSRHDVAYRQWVDWLRAARQNCKVLGIANHNWCTDPDFPSALTERLREGVEVKIFFLDPTKPPAATRAKEDNVRQTQRTICQSIDFVWRLRSNLEEALRQRLKIYVYEATPSCGVLWIDSFMVVTHYLPSSANVTSPSLIVRPVGTPDGRPDLYGVYAANVKAIEIPYSTPLTENNVGQYATFGEDATK